MSTDMSTDTGAVTATAVPDITETSPLSKANPNALAEFFSRDPLSLSDKDIVAMVEQLRQQRHLWLQTEAEKANKPKVARAKAGSKLPPSVANIDLSALDLNTLGL